jgi:hypothetical protein
MKLTKINDYCYQSDQGHYFVRAMFGGAGIVTVWLDGECLGTFNSSKNAVAFLSGEYAMNYANGNHKGDEK